MTGDNYDKKLGKSLSKSLPRNMEKVLADSGSEPLKPWSVNLYQSTIGQAEYIASLTGKTKGEVLREAVKLGLDQLEKKHG